MRETKEEVLMEHQPLETDGYQIHNIKKEDVEEGHREDGEKRDLQEEPHQEGHQVIVKLEYIEDEHEAVNKGALEEVQPLETEGYQIYHLKEEDYSADAKDLQETHQSVRQQIDTVKQEYLEDVHGLDDEALHMGPVEGVVEELDSSGTEEYQVFSMKEEGDQTEMQMSSLTQGDNHPPYSKKFDFGSNGAPSKGDKAEDGRSGKEPERKVGIPMSSTGKQDVRITKPGAESTILRHKSVVIPAIEDSVHQEAEEDPMNSTTCSHELESVNGNEHRDSRIYELRQSVQYPEGLNRSKHLKTQTQQSLQEICIAEGGRIPSEDYSCPYCNKIFRCKYNLSRHMRIHTGDKPYQCVHCNKKFARQSYLSLHIRTHTGEKPYQCLHCDKKFARHSDLSSHMRRHTGEKPYQCDHCNKTFSHQSSLSTHCKRMHTEEKPYQCVNCNKKFGTKKDFTCHIRIHAGEKPYQCIHCDKKFLRQSHLSCHLRTHTGEKPYQCVHCDKKFARQSHLSLHIQTHTGEKPFQCIQCNKKFIQRSYLTIHMRTHTGEKPYQCVHCDKKFAQQSNLLSHIRTHTGEKPYQCAQCDKKFAQQSALSIHMQTHTGEKPYECLHCNKKFASKHSVRYHIRTHTREKPYQCVHCNATFFKKSDLTSHIRTHTEEKPFQFETATQLKKSLPCSSLLKISRQLTNENSSKHGLDKWEKIQWEKVRHLTNLNSS